MREVVAMDCPFCGLPAVIKKSSINTTYFYVKCGGIGSECTSNVIGGMAKTEEGAIEIWNTRSHLERGIMKIGEIELTEESTGSKVTYVPTHAKNDASHEDCEGGTISSWNGKYVFVNYGKGTNAATRPEDLRWG